MAKKIKFTPVQNKAQREMDASFSEAFESLPLEMKKNLEQQGIQCFDDFIDHLLANGIDPVKLAYYSVKQKSKLETR